MTSLGRKVGKKISQSINEGQDLSGNISPDEANATLLIVRNETIELTGEVTITKKVYDTNAFVLDHTVRCDLDSSTLELDTGYDDTQEEVVVNKAF